MMHTKGPWKASIAPIMNAARGIQTHYQGEAWKDRLDEWNDITIANARLIAAAPELLEATEYALDILLNHPDADEMGLNPLQEAIRKAKEK